MLSVLSSSPSVSSSGSSSSPRSELSQLSTSSLASTFSDVSTTSSSSKTAAFFASPFSSSLFDAQPPRPVPRSLNTDFFAIPSQFDARPTPPPSVRCTSPPISRSNSPPRLLTRLFPSRYTSIQEPDTDDADRILSPVSPVSPHYTTSPISSDTSSEPDLDVTPRQPPFQPAFVLARGTVVADPDPPLKLSLIRSLGQGTFSSVWLASGDDFPKKRRHVRTKTVTPMDGLKPVLVPDSKGLERHSSVSSTKSIYLRERDGEETPEPKGSSGSRLVAVKMTPKSDEHTLRSFVREVEVLRHISHSSIVAHVASFSTDMYHILVLENISGGELFELINSDAAHTNLGENLLRRMWNELCKAVEWMHGVGLVHRDIKLENILLTTPPTLSPPPVPQPLIKLTDFGLARFIDPASPLLSTRCGSESYAAPELVMPTRPYDGRETDAWACGVVLYAMATRKLPFGEFAADEGAGSVRREGGGREGGHRARQRWLMRIARGEYEWPELPSVKNLQSTADELYGVDLASSAGLRRVVGRLLVREPTRRAKIADLWNEEWMGGEGPKQEEQCVNSEEGDGWIFDKEGIASIASQEVH